MIFDFVMWLFFNRDFVLVVLYEYGIGMIDNKIYYSIEGKKVILLSNVYKWNNGVVDLSYVFICYGSIKMLIVIF